MCAKTEYASQQLASNATELHALMCPLCAGTHPYPCGDHWHIGHVSKAVGDACKHDHHGYWFGRPGGRRDIKRVHNARDGKHSA
jgi:hypothetical protein